jgi:PAS domain S-box-containing protein
MDSASAERAALAFDTELAPHDDLETVLAHTPFLLTRCSSDLRYLFVSEAYARMIGHNSEELVGKKIIEIMGQTGFQTILPHVKAVLAGQRVEYETDVHFKDVGLRLLHVIYTPDIDRSGHVRGWVASIIDITEKRHAEQRIAADLHATMLLRDVSSECVRENATLNDCLYRILDAAIVIAGAQKGNIQLLDPPSRSLRIVAQRGFEEPFLKFFESVTDDASACAAALQNGTRVVIEDVLTSEIFNGQSSQQVMLNEDVRAVISTSLVSSKGHTLGMLSMHFQEPHDPKPRELHFLDLLTRQAADYLERKGAQETEQLLLREVQHRSNNLLAVVQAIAHHTFSGTNSFDQARKAFEGRLLALAQCNKRITRCLTGGVGLREIVYLLVGPFAGRVSAHGPDITVGPQPAQNLSLLLHELITNAAKYGALSRTSGKVEITWVVNRLPQSVQLTWREQGGPSVANPRHAGFGTMLLKATFPNAQIDYAPEGLCCKFELPTAHDDNNGPIYGSTEPNAAQHGE